jgi:hypothetical protein
MLPRASILIFSFFGFKSLYKSQIMKFGRPYKNRVNANLMLSERIQYRNMHFLWHKMRF